MSWQNQNTLHANNFKCGHCSREVASIYGFFESSGSGRAYICPNCNQLNLFMHDNAQIPGPLIGNNVQSPPEDVKNAYSEARKCLAAGAYTGSVLLSRKLLMNIAVTNGAEEGKTFLQYIEYLGEKNFIPPNGRGWVDHIRKKGNDATHQIAIMKKQDAEDLITFSQALLQFVYEFPSRIPGGG